MTREVARDPAARGDDSFDWRVSIAEVSRAGPFSRFAGYRRLIAIIGGRGMDLLASAGDIAHLKPHQTHAFDGESDVTGALPHGAVSDLNVIFRPGAVSASLRFSSEAGRWESSEARTIILLNVQAEPLRCEAAGQAIQLAHLDGVLATSGAAFSVAASGWYAAMELTKL